MTPPRQDSQGRGRPSPPPRILSGEGGGSFSSSSPSRSGRGTGPSPLARPHDPSDQGVARAPPLQAYHPPSGLHPPRACPPPPPGPGPPRLFPPGGCVRPGAPAVPAAAGGGGRLPPRPLGGGRFSSATSCLARAPRPPPPAARAPRSRPPAPRPLAEPPAARRPAHGDWPAPLSLAGGRGRSHSPLAERETTPRPGPASHGVRSLGGGGAIQRLGPAHPAAPLSIGGWRWLAHGAASLLIGWSLCSSSQPASSRFPLAKRGCPSWRGPRSYWPWEMSIRTSPSCCFPIEPETCHLTPGPAPPPVPLVGSPRRWLNRLLPFAGDAVTQGVAACLPRPPPSGT